MNNEGLLLLLQAIGERIEKEKDFLTGLDNVIADGDHGTNLSRGFTAVTGKLPSLEGKDVGTSLKTVGMTLVSAVGGSAGPLYGTFFMKLGMNLSGKTEISMGDFLPAFHAAIEGVMLRGRSTAGEKTMLDAMIPAVNRMDQALAEGKSTAEILREGVRAAQEGVEYTRTIPATKGRASYIGERSIGHQDPGATSFTEMLEETEAFFRQ